MINTRMYSVGIFQIDLITGTQHLNKKRNSLPINKQLVSTISVYQRIRKNNTEKPRHILNRGCPQMGRLRSSHHDLCEGAACMQVNGGPVP